MNHQTLSVERLTPIHDLAERREADAARLLGEAQKALDDRLRQLAELENYKEPAAGAGSALLQSAESAPGASQPRSFRRRGCRSIQPRRSSRGSCERRDGGKW